MKSLRAFARELFDTSCAIAKAQKINDPHEDLPLTVLYVPKGSRKYSLIVPVPAGLVDPPMMVEISLQAASAKWGPPSVVVNACDAHMKVMPDDFDHDSYERGDFANDPSSKEVLSIMAYCYDGELMVIGRYLPYGYDDDGEIRFDDVIDLELPPGGAIDEVIRQAFQ